MQATQQTTKITKDNVQQIIDEAVTAAKARAKVAFEEIGGDRGACGFAWVDIKPNRGLLCKTLKEQKLGSNGWNGGLCCWNPAGAHVQSVYVLEQGAYAFAEVLRKYNVNAWASSRLD